MTEPDWIDAAMALAIHDRQIAEHGGIPGIRDKTLLESALAKPQNLFAYADGAQTLDIPRMAASYAYGIARNHPFLDGNKRTALVVSQIFLALNGYRFTGSFEDEYMVFIKLASGELPEEDLTTWFRQNCVAT